MDIQTGLEASTVAIESTGTFLSKMEIFIGFFQVRGYEAVVK